MKKPLFAILLLFLIVPFSVAQPQIPDINSFSPLTGLLENIFLVIFLISFGVSAVRLVLLYRREGTLPFIHFFSNKKAITAVLVSLLGIAVFVYAMLQPWYTVQADIDTPVLKTDGLKQVISIDGGKGVTVDKSFLGGQSLPTQTNINLLLLSLVVSSVFGLIGASSLRGFGKNNLKSGIITMLLVSAIILIPVMLPQIVQSAKSSFSINTNNAILDAFIDDFAHSVSASPLKGEYTKNFTAPIQASIKILWGFEIGMYLFLVAGIVKITGGILGIVSSKSVDMKREK